MKLQENIKLCFKMVIFPAEVFQGAIWKINSQYPSRVALKTSSWQNMLHK